VAPKEDEGVVRDKDERLSVIKRRFNSEKTTVDTILAPAAIVRTANTFVTLAPREGASKSK
jgi:hypothetical protein